MGLLWLTFMNVFVGIFIAFIIFGSRTRRIGYNLKAVTFPEFLGKRFESKFIQGVFRNFDWYLYAYLFRHSSGWCGKFS